jgi:hypothetical protein
VQDKISGMEPALQSLSARASQREILDFLALHHRKGHQKGKVAAEVIKPF